jgi:hypothetical protein
VLRPTSTDSQTTIEAPRLALLLILSLAASSLIAGCATWKTSGGDRNDDESAAEQAIDGVERAHKHARLSLIDAYSRRGMDAAAESVRVSLAGDPEFEDALLRSRIDALLKGPRTLEAYAQLSRLRDTHPDRLPEDAYARFLVGFVQTMNSDPRRLAAMQELASLRPEHPAVQTAELHAERLAAVRRQFQSGRLDKARSTLDLVLADVESRPSQLPENLASSARLLDVELLTKQGTDDELREALNSYLLEGVPSSARFDHAIRALTKSGRSTLAVAWLDDAVDTLEQAGYERTKLYFSRAALRAKHGVRGSRILEDLEYALEAHADEREYLRAYTLIEAAGHPELGDVFLERVMSGKPSMHGAETVFEAYAKRGLQEQATAVADTFAEQVGTAAALARVASWMKQAGWVTRALEWTVRAVKRDPDNWLYSTQLYRWATEAGHSTYADRAARRLEQLADDNPSRLRSLSAEFQRQGQLQRAVDMLWKVYEQDGYIAYGGDIASLEAQLGHHDKAAEAYRKSLERDYVSATQWQMAGHQLERLSGLDYALPFFKEASRRGGSTHLAAYVSALQRAGESGAVHRIVTRFLQENAGAPTSIEILASRLRIDQLPGETRTQLLEAYAETGGRNERLARAVMALYAAQERWGAALSYLRKRYLARPQELSIRSPHRAVRRYRDIGLDPQLLDGILTELEESAEPRSSMQDNELQFAAILHTRYVHQLANGSRRSRRAPLRAASRSAQAARSYYSELIDRALQRHRLDEDLLRSLERAGYYELAEDYLLGARKKTDLKTFWQRYKRILERAGRNGAVEHVARRIYELLEPRDRPDFALQTAKTAASVGNIDSAEFFYRAALQSSQHADVTYRSRIRASHDASTGLGHLLLGQGRVREYLTLTADIDTGMASPQGTIRNPPGTEAVKLLWEYGYYDRYIERVRTNVMRDRDNTTGALHLARAYLHVGELERAMELLPRFSERADTVYRFAEDLQRMNEPELALRAIDAYDSTLDPTPATLLLLRTEIQLRQGRVESAARTLTRLEDPDQIAPSAALVRPNRWDDIRRTTEQTDSRGRLRDALEKAGSPDARDIIDALELDPDDDLSAARDLSDFTLASIAPNGSVTTNEMWRALQHGLDWPVARYVLQTGQAAAPRARGGGRTPYAAIQDSVVRLGLLPALADRLNVAGPQPSPANSLARIRLNLLDRRYDQLRAMLNSGTPQRSAWMAAIVVGDLELARSLQTSSQLRRQHPPSVLTTFADFQLFAALAGQTADQWTLGRADGGEDAVADLALAFQTAERISEGEVASVMDEVRHTFAQTTRRSGRRAADAKAAHRAITQLGVATIMGYELESRAILASTDIDVLTLDSTRKQLVLGASDDLTDVGYILPPNVVADRIQFLVTRGNLEAAKALLESHHGSGKLSGHRGRLVAAALGVAHERGDRGAFDRVMQAAIFDASTRTTAVNAGSRLALRYSDFDALAKLDFARGMLGATNDWMQAKLRLSSLGRVALLERLDRAPLLLSISSSRSKRRHLHPPVGALDHHRRQLRAEIEAYPADPRPALSLLVLELVNAPATRGRPQLERYVQKHAGDASRIRKLVDTLVEHELFSDIARFITPEIDPEALPVLTNRILYSAAIRTGRSAQAEALAALLVERLPDAPYVASMLANDAIKSGQLDLAEQLLSRTEGTREIPYGQLARARADLLGDDPDRGASAIHALLDANAIAPIDHCPVLVDAMHTDKLALQTRLLERYVLLPAFSSTRVADELMTRICDCFIEAGLAREGLSLIGTVFPELLGTTALAINPAVSLHLARLHRHAGNLGAAADHAHRAGLASEFLASGETWPASWREQARTALAIGDDGRAERLARRAIASRSDMNTAAGLVVLAEVYQARGDIERSELCLRYAYALHPSVFARNRIRIRLMRLPDTS